MKTLQVKEPGSQGVYRLYKSGSTIKGLIHTYHLSDSIRKIIMKIRELVSNGAQ